MSAPRHAVILAGGKGMRLRPYTTILPKPLLPVGDRPILHRVIAMLADAGFRDLTISVGHLAELIMAFFGDGAKYGLNIKYAIEDQPLGTIGPLRHIEGLGENFLVMNGDVLTDLDPNILWKSHMESGSLLTIATYQREECIDFGVLDRSEENRITAFREKPRIPYEVSMGVYVLNRGCLDFVPEDRPFGFDELVLALLAAGAPVRGHLHRGKWLDLGRPGDYEKATEQWAEGDRKV
ncbi:MAG: nucleotidyltransferase family protein [Candidatus Sumerlaeia bacterium]|nr:nucleotidyltransferase family protein [Candidatus Sumerlaeia bacterium]